MKENWTIDMQRILEGHKMDPPPGLWEGICVQMGIAPEPVPDNRPAATKRWYWAAVAGVLALVGLFVLYNQGGDEVIAEAGTASQETVSSMVQEKSVVDEGGAEHGTLVSSASSKMVRKPSSEPASAIEGEELTATAEPVEVDGNHEDRQRDSVEQHHVPAPAIPDVPSYPEPSYVATKKPSADDSRWTIGLNASGGLLAAGNSVNTGRFYYTQAMAESGSLEFGMTDVNNGGDYSSYVGSLSSYMLAEHTSKHRLPVRFGLSLQYQLNPHLALLSGVSYTRLYSEFSFPLYQNISYSQNLHYIGIPLGVVWQLWTANRFSFYCSGGAMVEKCVSVSLNGDYSGKKPWQWSVNGAIGAEYAFTSLLGAYLEPSLGYYFSDGTQLEHYYKEHPLAPSIEFGLRMHLGR